MGTSIVPSAHRRGCRDGIGTAKNIFLRSAIRRPCVKLWTSIHTAGTDAIVRCRTNAFAFHRDIGACASSYRCDRGDSDIGTGNVNIGSYISCCLEGIVIPSNAVHSTTTDCYVNASEIKQEEVRLCTLEPIPIANLCSLQR